MSKSPWSRRMIQVFEARSTPLMLTRVDFDATALTAASSRSPTPLMNS